ncbi:hypothetical protein [Cohnella terricola]|uniref:hypothetical protein n=1 Tax=Cohnella terricola TaxID=1289167 RepID=UPI001648B7BC|nr:hypothetical protein [Cohnella terricola]
MRTISNQQDVENLRRDGTPATLGGVNGQRLVVTFITLIKNNIIRPTYDKVPRV